MTCGEWVTSRRSWHNKATCSKHQWRCWPFQSEGEGLAFSHEEVTCGGLHAEITSTGHCGGTWCCLLKPFEATLELFWTTPIVIPFLFPIGITQVLSWGQLGVVLGYLCVLPLEGARMYWACLRCPSSLKMNLALD